MARQFDICQTDDGALVLVLQTDMLEDLPTRVVAPLIPEGMVSVPFGNLMPALQIGERQYRFLPQQTATLPRAALTRRLGSAEHRRGDLMRALGLLHTGV